MPPTEPIGPLNRSVVATVVGILRTVLRTVFHMRLADMKALPDGPVILAPNHRSFIDPAVLGALADRRVTFMMTSKYYDVFGLGWLFRLARCIVVEDEADNRSVLRAAREALDAGHVLCIFPEGHISPDGNPLPGQPGVAWLAAKTGAPVIPVHLSGTREALPRGSWFPRPATITARMGEPMFMDGYPPGRAGQRAFTDALMEAIAELGRKPLR